MHSTTGVPYGCLALWIVAAALHGEPPQGQHPAATQLRPHPDALPNTHRAGDVDKPELVPFIVKQPGQLAGIVVDETQAQLIGTWRYSTHTPPYVGLGYVHDQKTNKSKNSVIFRPHLPRAGVYEVRLSHCYNIRRASNTPVTVQHADGQSSQRINQQQTPRYGRLFRSLGKFRFLAGRHGWVRISTEGTEGKYVIADAVQFIPIHDKSAPSAARSAPPRNPPPRNPPPRNPRSGEQ
ncbi:MAG: xanthan lyase [Planctomycetaceae bacterium]